MDKIDETPPEKVHNPHDHFLKNCLKKKEVHKAFFEKHLPAFVLEHVDLDNLVLTGSEFIDEALKSSYSDMLFSTCLSNGIS